MRLSDGKVRIHFSASNEVFSRHTAELREELHDLFEGPDLIPYLDPSALEPWPDPPS